MWYSFSHGKKRNGETDNRIKDMDSLLEIISARDEILNKFRVHLK